MNELADLSQHLRAAARTRPDQPALVCSEGRISFAELEERCLQCSRGLLRIGIERGTRTALLVRPGIDFLTLAFALIRVRAVLVLVDPGIGWKNLGRCLDQASPRAFIGVPLAQAARLLLRWGVETVSVSITLGGLPFAGGWTLAQVMRLGEAAGEVESGRVSEDDPAAVVFTTGSTGPPKGVLYSHKMFSAQADLLRGHFGIQPGEVDLATFPLFALFDAALGMTTVFPEMDFTRPGRVDPSRIIRPIQEHSVTHMFGSPALLDRVGRFGEINGLKLPTLKRVLSAGAPIGWGVIERFSGLLGEAAEIHTPYGATEALPVCSIESRELAEQSASPQKGVCVGREVAGVKVALIRISDDPIDVWSDDLEVAPGEVGELVVWGPNVSREYFHLPEATRLAKIGAPEGEIRHRMGDLGCRDPQGRIWFYGRKSQRVVTSGGCLYTVPCEKVFNQHPKVFRSALVGIGRPPRQTPVLCVETEHGAGPDSQLIQELLDLAAAHPHCRGIRKVFFHKGFPVDIRHNAKIGREKLAVWAARQPA